MRAAFSAAPHSLLAIFQSYLLGKFSESLIPYMQGGDLQLLDKGKGPDALPRPVLPSSMFAKVASRLLLDRNSNSL
eukprot:m.278508 g.278508  ORF g.278508 m.278508 type:complete len:76 (-) comp11101_c0_seq98:1142-1369(-)